MLIKEGAPLKLVTVKGECFEIGLRRKQENLPDRVGVLYLFHINDLTDKNRGRRLISVYRFGPQESYGPNYDERLETVLLNTIRRAFDSGRLTFDGPYDPHTYTEILLQPEDFRPQRTASGDEIQELIKHEAYWLGFRYNPNPRYPISFDSPTDLDYLGVSSNDVKRYVMLLEHRGLLEKVLEGVGRPTPKLIETVESASTRPEDDHTTFGRMAIEEAKLSIPEPDGRTHPKVGVVIIKDGHVLAKAHRGEFSKEHAEFIALEKKLSDVSVVGATVYATLEPCTTRTHPKVPCAIRLVERKVARVFIGMLDPNPEIRGMGQRVLSEANIETQLFPRELMAQVEELNREFIRRQKQRQTKIAWTDAELEMVADDPRIYVAIKEPNDAMFPRTPFVLTNSGGVVAHRVMLEMPWKLKGRNVSFEMVETIPAGENRESLPTIGEEGLTSKHDIFYWLLQDWNGDSRGICEEWPRPLTVRVRRFLTAKAIRDFNDADVLPDQTHA
jgi:pyrimidine deaminase RibD-like protein